MFHKGYKWTNQNHQTLKGDFKMDSEKIFSMAAEYFDMQHKLYKMKSELEYYLVENNMQQFFSINWDKIRKHIEREGYHANN